MNLEKKWNSPRLPSRSAQECLFFDMSVLQPTLFFEIDTCRCRLDLKIIQIKQWIRTSQISSAIIGEKYKLNVNIYSCHYNYVLVRQRNHSAQLQSAPGVQPTVVHVLFTSVNWSQYSKDIHLFFISIINKNVNFFVKYIQNMGICKLYMSILKCLKLEWMA